MIAVEVVLVETTDAATAVLCTKLEARRKVKRVKHQTSCILHARAIIIFMTDHIP